MARRALGSLVYRKDRGMWYGVADVGRDRRGKRSRKWTRGFERQEDAKRALRELLATGRPTVPGNFTLASLVSEYIDHSERRGRQKTTIERYRSLLRSNIALKIGGVKVSSLKAERLNRLYEELRNEGLSGTTIAHVHGLLCATLRWARHVGKIDMDVLVGVDAPRRERSRARAIRQDEARSFFAWLPTSHWKRWEPLFLVALATGMRRGEVVALRIENVDLERGIVIVAEAIAESRGVTYRKTTKTEEIREIALSTVAIEALTRQLEQRAADKEAAGEAYEDHDLVFTDELGRRLRPMAVTDAFRRAADRFKLMGCTLHTLRHTAATWLLAGGTDLRTTSAILGHSDASTTLRIYAHVVHDRQRSAVEVIGNILKPTAAKMADETADEASARNRKSP
uniref:Site-specific integrase n=1 Tax=mine drainage metagenome TaxID=410659 RepID=E6Q2D6_9ZZZZ